MHIKHRFILIGLLAVLLLSSFAFVGSAAAKDQICYALEIDFRNDTGETRTARMDVVTQYGVHIISVSLTLAPGETGTMRLVTNLPLNQGILFGHIEFGGLTLLSVAEDIPTSDNCDGGRIGDGRINDGASQLAAPVAVYCHAGNIDIYRIDAETGAGELVISVPQVSGAPADGTTQLAAEGGVILSWREDGKYQVNTVNFEGNPYIIAWQGCDGRTLDYIAPQPSFD
jgi:hypothetical protein